MTTDKISLATDFSTGETIGVYRNGELISERYGIPMTAVEVLRTLGHDVSEVTGATDGNGDMKPRIGKMRQMRLFLDDGIEER